MPKIEKCQAEPSRCFLTAPPAVPQMDYADHTVETVKNGGYQIARIRNIPANELKDSFTVTVTAGGASGRVTYSPMNYCGSILNDPYDAVLVSVIKALVLYAQAADTYFDYHPVLVDLGALSGDYEAKDGDILTGTLSGDKKLTVADGATVILKNADITCLSFDAGFAGITPLGDATIVLEETNTVKGSGNYPGIYSAVDHTLTIEGTGTGSLNASTGNNSPSTPDDSGGKDSGGCGIGGGYGIDAGNIVINSGTITATGGFDAAGIGSGGYSECGLITISGGTVTANGGYNGAGIGSGYAGSCGQIKISGGTVTANGGNYSAGIGSGHEGDYGRVDIISTVTRITATRGDGCPHSIGPGNSSGFTIHKVYIDGEWVDSITESPYTYTPTN